MSPSGAHHTGDVRSSAGAVPRPREVGLTSQVTRGAIGTAAGGHRPRAGAAQIAHDRRRGHMSSSATRR
eukprot:7379498-Prymnesium_polylepis.3